MCEKEKFLYVKYICLRYMYLEKADKPVNVSIMSLLDESKHFHKNCASENCMTPRNRKVISEAVLKGLAVVTARRYCIMTQ